MAFVVVTCPLVPVLGGCGPHGSRRPLTSLGWCPGDLHPPLNGASAGNFLLSVPGLVHLLGGPTGGGVLRGRALVAPGLGMVGVPAPPGTPPQGQQLQ